MSFFSLEWGNGTSLFYQYVLCYFRSPVKTSISSSLSNNLRRKKKQRGGSTSTSPQQQLAKRRRLSPLRMSAPPDTTLQVSWISQIHGPYPLFLPLVVLKIDERLMPPGPTFENCWWRMLRITCGTFIPINKLHCALVCSLVENYWINPESDTSQCHGCKNLAPMLDISVRFLSILATYLDAKNSCWQWYSEAVYWTTCIH